MFFKGLNKKKKIEIVALFFPDNIPYNDLVFEKNYLHRKLIKNLNFFVKKKNKKKDASGP